ncbi:hypothetical protein Hanom_Chr13g01194381 [Helianthus anomalus]
MIRVRNFECTFRAFGIEPTVGDFRRFYQMTVPLGFFSFRQRDGSHKLMVPPKGMTKWKTKFFYIKVVAVAAKLTFRNVTDTVDWFPRLWIIGWKKLSNSQLWVLQMMLGRISRKVRHVVRDKSGEDAPIWRMFHPHFKGKVEVLACADGEEGFNHTIRDNFRLPERDAMEAALPQGKGDLGALGDPDATGVPKQHMEKHGDKRFRKQKKPHEPVVVPPLVPKVADVSAAGGQKGPKLRRTRTAAISQPKLAVVTDVFCFVVQPREETFPFFNAPSSPPLDAAADVEVHKEDRRIPSIEVVTPPSAHAKETGKKAAGQTMLIRWIRPTN